MLLIVNYIIAHFKEKINRFLCRCGGIGRRKGLKIPRCNNRIGSSPISGTKNEPYEYVFVFIELVFLFSKDSNRRERERANYIMTFGFGVSQLNASRALPKRLRVRSAAP